MCLALPCKVTHIEGDIAKIEISGVQRDASILLVNDIQVGDYVIVHAGYAIHKIDEAAALYSLKALDKVLSPDET
ncbi:MAG: HypC/HybG/HupF family hydrogenase formation chaperone [Thermodesulfobacteriota bacterium]